MNDVDTKTPEIEAVPKAAVAPDTVPATPETAATPLVERKTALRGRARRGGGERRGRGRERGERQRSEFDQATISVRRVARVMAGGRRFNFSVVVVIGDRRGRVGIGLGKAGDTALAIDKATRDGKRRMITVLRTSTNSIPHDVEAKYSSSTVQIRPSPGRGLVAGSAMRTVLELAGVTDIVTKILTRSKNKLTIARATVEALRKLSPR